MPTLKRTWVHAAIIHAHTYMRAHIHARTLQFQYNTLTNFLVPSQTPPGFEASECNLQLSDSHVWGSESQRQLISLGMGTTSPQEAGWQPSLGFYTSHSPISYTNR